MQTPSAPSVQVAIATLGDLGEVAGFPQPLSLLVESAVVKQVFDAMGVARSSEFHGDENDERSS